MPLDKNTKTESKSIEDLIAQLDAPNLTENNDCSQHQQQQQNDCRKIIRGKRTNSTSGNGGGGSGNGTASTEYYDPVLHKNILTSKKYSKAIRSTKGRGLAKKGGSGGKHTWYEQLFFSFFL
jgi:hypothetical protein